MGHADSNKFMANSAIIVTPFALDAFILACAPAGHVSAEDPEYDGFVQLYSTSEAPIAMEIEF